MLQKSVEWKKIVIQFHEKVMPVFSPYKEYLRDINHQAPCATPNVARGSRPASVISQNQPLQSTSRVTSTITQNQTPQATPMVASGSRHTVADALHQPQPPQIPRSSSHQPHVSLNRMEGPAIPVHGIQTLQHMMFKQQQPGAKFPEHDVLRIKKEMEPSPIHGRNADPESRRGIDTADALPTGMEPMLNIHGYQFAENPILPNTTNPEPMPLNINPQTPLLCSHPYLNENSESLVQPNQLNSAPLTPSSDQNDLLDAQAINALFGFDDYEIPEGPFLPDTINPALLKPSSECVPIPDSRLTSPHSCHVEETRTTDASLFLPHRGNTLTPRQDGMPTLQSLSFFPLIDEESGFIYNTINERLVEKPLSRAPSSPSSSSSSPLSSHSSRLSLPPPAQPSTNINLRFNGNLQTEQNITPSSSNSSPSPSHEAGNQNSRLGPSLGNEVAENFNTSTKDKSISGVNDSSDGEMVDNDNNNLRSENCQINQVSKLIQKPWAPSLAAGDNDSDSDDIPLALATRGSRKRIRKMIYSSEASGSDNQPELHAIESDDMDFDPSKWKDRSGWVPGMKKLGNRKRKGKRTPDEDVMDVDPKATTPQHPETQPRHHVEPNAASSLHPANPSEHRVDHKATSSSRSENQETPPHSPVTPPYLSPQLCCHYCSSSQPLFIKPRGTYEEYEIEEEKSMSKAREILKSEPFRLTEVRREEAAKVLGALYNISEQERNLFLTIPFDSMVDCMRGWGWGFHDHLGKMVAEAVEKAERKRQREENHLKSPEHKRHRGK